MSSGDGSGSDGDEARYSPEQVRDLLDELGEADFDAIEKASQWFGRRTGVEPEDLQQEALARAMETRTCKVGTDMTRFICGIMKSLASEGPRAKKAARRKAEARGEKPQPVGIEIAFVKDYESLGGDEGDVLSPEAETLSRVIRTRKLERAMACISDDDDLLLLVEGIYDGMVGGALEELLGLETKGLAALRKKLGRRLAACFPAGAPL